MTNNNNNNNNNNFNINNVNLNKLKNYLPDDNHTYFFIIMGVVLITLIILIIRNFLHGASLYQRYVKNVFFREMDNLKSKPLDVSNLAGSNFDICIQGETMSQNFIPNTNLHIKDDYLLMFWVRLESEKIHKFIEQSPNNPVSLVSFGNGSSNVYPKFEMDITKNEMSVYVNDNSSNKPISKLYNLPFDEWFSISSFITNDHMDIYINGKLVKILEYKVNINASKAFNMSIGPYPGSIAYLQVNNDSSYFNPASIYEEYLVYKTLIKRYVDNQYYNKYKISEIVNKGHSNDGYNSGYKRKNREKPNICNNN